MYPDKEKIRRKSVHREHFWKEMMRMQKKRNAKICVRLNDSELKKIVAEADEQGVDLSKYVRYKLLADSEKSKYNATYISCIRQLVYEINRIGNNVNQIAYQMNVLRYDAGYVSELRKNFETCERLILNFVLQEENNGNHKTDAY